MEGSGTDPMPGQSFRVVVTMEGISVFPIQLTRSENCAVKVSTSDEHFLDDRQTGRVIEGVELPPPPQIADTDVADLAPLQCVPDQYGLWIECSRDAEDCK